MMGRPDNHGDTETRRRHGDCADLEDEALDAVLEHRDVEVDEESDPPSAEPKVRQQLGLVYGLETLNGLEFDDNRIVDHDVEAIAHMEMDPLVFERQRNFGRGRQAAESQLMNQTDPIGTLQQTRTKVSVDLDGGPDDLLGEIFLQ
jgi:hypothetical protein